MLSRTRLGLSIMALSGVLALSLPASGALAKKSSRVKATRSAECALIDITIGWPDIGIQPIRICI